MHRIRLLGRPVALVAVTAVLLAVVAWFSGSVPQQDRAYADLDWADRYYVACTDMYLEIDPVQPKGDPPGPEDLLTSKSLTRGEPSQTVPGAVDLTSVSYLGPDFDANDGNPIPDKPPSEECLSKLNSGQFEPENFRLNNRLNYQMVSNERPTTVGMLVEKIAGDPPELVTNLMYTTCSPTGTDEFWTRTDINMVLREKGEKGVNYGDGLLYTEANSPIVPGDPTTCIAKTPILYVNMFPFRIVSYTRDATTDHPELAKNDIAILMGDLMVDPDGPNQPKPADAKQLPDGANELAKGPYDSGGIPVPALADDWDGDGCPDWDELDPHVFQGIPDYPVNGLDPFNPHDCNVKVNPGGIYRVRAVVVPSDKEIPGAYYHCIADMQGNVDALETRIYCYIDIPGVPVNPQAGPESGDGYENIPPPEPYGDVDDVHTVLTGNKKEKGGQGKLFEMAGCFEDRDGASALGHIYVDAQYGHDGKGTVSLWVFQTQEDCKAGTPVGDPAVGELHMLKVAEKGPCDKTGPRCGAGGEHDFDGDNCPDKAELSDNQQQGGLRDPYNRWDYMNPTLDGQNRVDDILATVNQYFIDKGNPDYTKATDRTAVIGANPWNLGPPNGQQRVDDILASVKSYFHDCSGGKYDDPDDEVKLP